MMFITMARGEAPNQMLLGMKAKAYDSTPTVPRTWKTFSRVTGIDPNAAAPTYATSTLTTRYTRNVISMFRPMLILPHTVSIPTGPLSQRAFPSGVPQSFLFAKYGKPYAPGATPADFK